MSLLTRDPARKDFYGLYFLPSHWDNSTLLSLEIARDLKIKTF